LVTKSDYGEQFPLMMRRLTDFSAARNDYVLADEGEEGR